MGGPGGRGRGPMGGMGMAMPTEKPKDFRGTFRRLLGELRPERPWILVVVAVAFLSTAGQVFGPKILGNGINQLMDGLVGKELGQYMPAGTTHAQAVAILNQAHSPLADLVAGTTAVPGVGTDFGALGMVLIGLAALYLAATFFSWVAWYVMAGVAQRTVYRLRREVDQKLGRLPLRYFDTHAHGDTLSRVTNDIDNIANTLQQSLTQIITSFTTIIGVLAMMFWISPMLAVISLLVLPVAAILTMLIARQSQKQFAAQWERTGVLNGQVEESHTGHAIVKVFGHQEDAVRQFDEENQRVYEAA
jgi:ATP-binding cassette subfamily B protein